jgi:hypothetical protein
LKRKIIGREKNMFTHSKNKVIKKGKIKCPPSRHVWR